MQKPRITVRSQMQATVTSRLAGRLRTIAGAAAGTSDVLVRSWAEAGRNRQNPGAGALGHLGGLRGCPAVAPAAAAPWSSGEMISCVLVKRC